MRRLVQILAVLVMTLAMPVSMSGAAVAGMQATGNEAGLGLDARALAQVSTASRPASPGVSATPTSRPAAPIQDDFNSEAEEPDFALTINNLEPRVLTGEDKVRISGTVASKEEDLEDVELNVYLRADSLVTIPQMEHYLQAESFPGQYVTTAELGDLKAGKSKPFTITVDKADLPLGSAFNWGPRGLEVAASAGDVRASDRTIFMWDSGYEVEPTALSVVSTLSEDVVNTSAGVSTSLPTLPQKDLAMELAGLDGVTLAVGAGLLETESFSEELARVVKNPVISLPAADADITGIAHLNTQSEFTQLVKDSKSAENLTVSSQAGIEVLDSFVIPYTERLDLATIQTWNDQTIISRGTGLGPIEILTYDPSTWTRYDVETGESVTFENEGVDVLVAHDTLSKLLSIPASGPDQELDIQQMLRATTAIITRQLPNMGRTLVAMTARNPEEPALKDRVESALSDRWVKPLGIEDVMANADESVPRTPLPDLVPTAGAITDGEVRTLREAIESTAAMTSALEDSTGIVAQQRSRVLLASALALRQKPELRSALIDGVVEEAGQLATSVKVEQSAPINVLDRSARLPVRVSSTLGEPVNTIVELLPSDPRLQVDEPVEVQIPANSSTVVEVPVRAVGSGNVSIQVKVKGPNGLIIDDNTQLTVRVRAEWESKGMAVAAALLALLLIVGILRTIKRGRRIDYRDADTPGEASLVGNAGTSPGEASLVGDAGTSPGEASLVGNAGTSPGEAGPAAGEADDFGTHIDDRDEETISDTPHTHGGRDE